MLALQLLRDGPILVAALLAVGGLAYLFAKSASAAAWALVAAFVTTQGIVPSLNIQATQGGITLYALDVVAGLMLAIGVSRLVTRASPPSILLPLAALSALFMIHVAWGIATFGLQVAVNGSRSWLYLLGPLVYASFARPRWTRSSFVPLIVGAGALAVFALAQIARHGLYGANEFIEIRGELIDARPVTASGALLIVQCVLIAAAGRFVRSTIWWLGIASLGVAAILLQHRTVWIIALVLAAIAYVRWARVAIIVNERAAAGAAAAILLVAPVVITLVASSGAFQESVRSATGENSTLDWRTKSWRSLVESRSSEELLVGLPAGTSLERRIGNQIATQSPHNVYVDSLLSFGLLGPLIMAWLWILILRSRRNAAAVLGVSSVAVALIVVSQALFGITNMLGPLQGLLLGMLLQAAWFTGRDLRGQPWSGRGFVRANAVR